MKQSRFGLWMLVVVILATGVGGLIAMSVTRPKIGGDDVPVAEVRRGDLTVEIRATGELNANHTMMVTAPPVGGDSLQITHLAKTGDRVKKGDVVLEFDPSEQQYKL